MRSISIEYPARGEMLFCDLGAPPDLKPTEILVRTHYSAITNGTERHALLAEHAWNVFPSRHGYQHVGMVESAGSDVRAFKSGDWVFCGQYVGHRAWQVVDVAAADVHSSGSHLCIALPDDVDRKHCALLGVAGVAMRGIGRSRVAPAHNVWVAGAGLIGQFAAQCARAVGARVTISDINQGRLSVATELGAHRAISAVDLEPLKRAAPYDRIVDACGVESLFLDVHKHGLLAHQGAILALAVRSETVFHWATLHGREASIEVSCHFSLHDLHVLLHFVRQGIIRIQPLVSHVVPIEKAPAIYEMLRDRPGELLGVIFDWT